MYPSEWGHEHGLPLWKGEQCSSVGRQFYGEGPPAPGGHSCQLQSSDLISTGVQGRMWPRSLSGRVSVQGAHS